MTPEQQSNLNQQDIAASHEGELHFRRHVPAIYMGFMAVTSLCVAVGTLALWLFAR